MTDDGIGYHATWEKAHAAAARVARDLNLDVALRRVKVYGREQFSVHLASRMDSDYAWAEIVRPGDPK
jgi:hypothetical protein